MNKPYLYFIFWLLTAVACQSPKALFQEKNDDWFAKGDADWKFLNNELVGTISNGNGLVMTRKSYGDFVLELEFHPDSTINSGVFIRCKNEELSATDCYEINIWDLNPNQDYRTGGVVLRSKPLAHVETLNQWNSYKIQCKNNHVQSWVNGILTTDLQNDELATGRIALQARGQGTIMFRNVRIREL
ncbi:MAG: DUF1080 domain-containing protein [Cyclobacteriaceae bacterium]|nr:DUF1080 domain-containing protein [Cyclobacteriaceae bacterium]